jgi:signal transduction histidine kinase
MVLRVTAPAVTIGLVLFLACLAGMRYVNRLQNNLADVLSRNVASLQAAEELQIRVRQVRHHTLLYLMDPSPERQKHIDDVQWNFEEALNVARRASHSAEEQARVGAIESGYEKYRAEQAQLRAFTPRSVAEFHKLAEAHPIKLVDDPCRDLLQLNKDQLAQAAEEGRRVSEQGRLVMLLLGLAGPAGGLVAGYGVARGLRRSIYRMSVRVQDMAQHLDRDVGSVSVVADGDLRTLDRQMEYIVGRVEEAAGRLQQQQRELLRADQLGAVGQLAAGVAHEVRNPLTGIKMLVEAALRPDNRTPLNAEDLRVIHREVTRLEQTVQAFLSFARVPSPQRERCDLLEVVAQARDLVRGRAQQQQVEIRVEDPGRPVPGFVDRGQLSTVLVNLLLNALDAMPQGGRLDVEVSDGSPSGVRLRVKDTGGGIPPEVAGRLFTPFATSKPTGTGLGLSIARRILEEHGGRITAENRPGGGACFTITLPAAAPEPSHAQPVGH